MKESNPEALYYDRPKNGIPHSIGSLRQSNFDVFSPRGDNAKDAFEQSLTEMLREDDLDF